MDFDMTTVALYVSMQLHDRDAINQSVTSYSINVV